MGDTEPGAEELSHNSIIEKAKKLMTVLFDDPFLHDVVPDCSVEDARYQLALAQGKAITVHIHKLDGDIASVLVLQGATVSDLMKAFERKVQKQCVALRRTRHLNWRYVWRTYWLAQEQTLLQTRKAQLASYGVGNQTHLRLTKQLKVKS